MKISAKIYLISICSLFQVFDNDLVTHTSFAHTIAASSTATDNVLNWATYKIFNTDS